MESYTRRVEGGYQSGAWQNRASACRVYEGNFENNKKHGHDEMTYVCGEVYDGEWKNGMREGHGKMTFASGDVCEGEFKEGKQRARRDDACQWQRSMMESGRMV